jgi:hypothetical protein
MNMKAIDIDIGSYFQPVLGQRPWRARLGVGSFLTFEFGRRVKENGHIRGEWHLWIYQSNWVLLHRDRPLVSSDSERQSISVAVRRLENTSFTNVDFDSNTLTTTFEFEDFRLIVSPADYLDEPDERDEYWLFFLPEKQVLTVGPKGASIGSSDQP